MDKLSKRDIGIKSVSENTKLAETARDEGLNFQGSEELRLMKWKKYQLVKKAGDELSRYYWEAYINSEEYER